MTPGERSSTRYVGVSVTGRCTAPERDEPVIGYVGIGVVVALALSASRGVKKWLGPVAAAVLGGVGGFLGGGAVALMRGSVDFTALGGAVAAIGAMALVALASWSKSSRRRTAER